MTFFIILNSELQNFLIKNFIHTTFKWQLGLKQIKCEIIECQALNSVYN
jgi:hypothetical protein